MNSGVLGLAVPIPTFPVEGNTFCAGSKADAIRVTKASRPSTCKAAQHRVAYRREESAFDCVFALFTITFISSIPFSV